MLSTKSPHLELSSERTSSV